MLLLGAGPYKNQLKHSELFVPYFCPTTASIWISMATQIEAKGTIVFHNSCAYYGSFSAWTHHTTHQYPSVWCTSVPVITPNSCVLPAAHLCNTSFWSRRYTPLLAIATMMFSRTHLTPHFDHEILSSAIEPPPSPSCDGINRLCYPTQGITCSLLYSIIIRRIWKEEEKNQRQHHCPE